MGQLFLRVLEFLSAHPDSIQLSMPLGFHADTAANDEMLSWQSLLFMMAYLQFLCPRDRDDVLPLAEEPCQRGLPGGRIVTFADIMQTGSQLIHIGKVFLRESVSGDVMIRTW